MPTSKKTQKKLLRKWADDVGLQLDTSLSPKQQFAALAAHKGWAQGNTRWCRSWKACFGKDSTPGRVEAINAYFADKYGTDFSKLEKWQQLCIDVDVDPVPSSIKQCKIALRKLWVNIYDFLEHPRPVQCFDSYSALVKYTLAGRTYPLELAKEDGFINVFLKPIMRSRRS